MSLRFPKEAASPLRGVAWTLLLVGLTVPLGAVTGRGVEFWAAWPRSHASLETSAVLVVLADQPTPVEIDGAFTASGVAEATAPWIVSLPDTLRLAEERTPQDLAFRIRSVDGATPVSVLFRVPEQAEASDDIARLLPTSELGTRYVVTGYAASIPVAPSYYLVIATEDGTNITTMTSCGGDPGPVLLDAGQVYQVFCDSSDLPPDVTGSVVDADRPVAVLAGSSNAWVPTDRLSGDFLVEALVPVSAWSNEYLTAPLPKGPGVEEPEDIVRITASAAAQVTVDDGLAPQVVDLTREGDWVELRSDQALHISSSAPVDVHIYAPGVESSDIGDPFQTRAFPPGEAVRWLRSYAPADYSEGAFVSLFAPGAETGAVRFAGQPVSGWTPVAGSGWSTARIPLGAFQGTRLLSSAGSLGALAYGFNATYVPDPDLGRVPGSYGYPVSEAFPSCRLEAVPEVPAEACPQSLIVLDVADVQGTGCNQVEYRWLDGAVPLPGCSFSADPRCDVLFQGDLDVVLEVRCADDPTECAPATVAVRVPESPPESLDLLPDPAVVCQGETLPLQAPAGYQSYQWTSVPGDPGVTPRTTATPSVVASPEVDTTYSVRATGGSLCVGQGDRVVQVLPDPLPPPLGVTLRVEKAGPTDLLLRWTDLASDPVLGYEAVALRCGGAGPCPTPPAPAVLEGRAGMAPPAAPGLEMQQVSPPVGRLVFLKLRALSPCAGAPGPLCDGFPAQEPCP